MSDSDSEECSDIVTSAFLEFYLFKMNLSSFTKVLSKPLWAFILKLNIVDIFNL